MIRPLDRDDTTSAYVTDLIDQAHKQRLSTRTEWRRLGHWRSSLLGFVESQADGPNFFLASGGKSSPGAELDATLRAFFSTVPAEASDVQHPICQFPARYRWLDKQLHFDPARVPHPGCPRFEEFLKETNAERLSFVFSSYYLNNPASVFGHTFVRIIQKGKASEQRRELLDHAIEFSATVNTDNALIYGIKGIFGMFPGTYRNLPYFFKVRQYNDYESRDLYEYELNFTREEIDTFLEHLWELGSTYFDYYYVSENCSYHLLGALEAARPKLELLKHMHWPVVPADTIKALYANKDFVGAVRFRPSLRLQFRERLRSLDSRELGLVDQLAYDPATVLPKDLSSLGQVKVLDAAQDLIDMRFAKELAHEVDSAGARMKQQLLERRATIPMASDAITVSTPYKSMPQRGHDSRRIGVGYAVQDSSFTKMPMGTSGTMTQSLSLDFRLALHDLADPIPGYPEFSQLEFLPIKARVDLETGNVDLDSISFVRVISLTPQDRFDRKLSFHIDAGMLRLEDPGCTTKAGDCYAGRLSLGSGVTLASERARLITFAFLDLRILSGPGLEGIEGIHLRAGAGPSVGVRLRLADRLVSLTTGELIWLPDQRPKATWEARTILRLGLGKSFALSLEGTVDQYRGQGQLTSLLYF